MAYKHLLVRADNSRRAPERLDPAAALAAQVVSGAALCCRYVDLGGLHASQNTRKVLAR
ncbi:MAG TPA: hypothetical protein VFR85_14160 [Anaeromyxobacteraceae bacterium]|nr:hypothetical protein [Anaeromyxobacteraceae bacterium]